MQFLRYSNSRFKVSVYKSDAARGSVEGREPIVRLRSGSHQESNISTIAHTPKYQHTPIHQHTRINQHKISVRQPKGKVCVPCFYASVN